MTDYKSMDDQARMTALFHHSLNLERLKQRRKILKDSPPTDQMAAEWAQEIKAVGEEIKLVRAEIKSFWEQIR